MSRVISYAFDNPFSQQDDEDSGELEFPDGTTDDEVDEAVRELFFNRYNFGWSDAEQPTSHGAEVSNG